MSDTVHILFAATSDFLPQATVTALSAIDHLKPKTKAHIHFLYADIVKPISENMRNNFFERAKRSIESLGATISFYDVSDQIHLFDGQNIGMWGKEISLTHYMYLLAPNVLDVDKAIYLDTDMIVNCDLSEVYNIDFGNHLLAMGAPRGQEEMGDDVSNSGFVFLNLKLWRQENTLKQLVDFGEKLPRARFCDQYLLYQYFTKHNPHLLMLVDKSYNIFPQLFPEMDISDIKVLHFTGWHNIKPWVDVKGEQRGGDLWWFYARKTGFYESFVCQLSTQSFNKNTNALKQSIEKELERRDAWKYKLIYKLSLGKMRQKYKQKYKNAMK